MKIPTLLSIIKKCFHLLPIIFPTKNNFRRYDNDLINILIIINSKQTADFCIFIRNLNIHKIHTLYAKKSFPLEI